eukprot:TRINITY_DN21183_c0_g1_i1.p1 TRINITY_DN21183_c0_g1~~TRINITY_DN21183_c0_g1_i1.p1  ORF type:complete len:552 (+),score=131.95 TRINITY_DN21183_c0_g1_i1:70-1656(+)
MSELAPLDDEAVGALLAAASGGRAQLRRSEQEGRHCVAARPLGAGEEVLRCEPLLTQLSASACRERCALCLRPVRAGPAAERHRIAALLRRWDGDGDGAWSQREAGAFIRAAEGAGLGDGDWRGLCGALGADPRVGLDLAALEEHYRRGGGLTVRDEVLSPPPPPPAPPYPRCLYEAASSARPHPLVRLYSARRRAAVDDGGGSPGRPAGCGACGRVLWCAACAAEGRRRHRPGGFECRALGALPPQPPEVQSGALMCLSAAARLSDGGNARWVATLAQHAVSGTEAQRLAAAGAAAHHALAAAARTSPRDCPAEPLRQFICSVLPTVELFNAFAVHAPERPARVALPSPAARRARLTSPQIIYPGASQAVGGELSISAEGTGSLRASVSSDGREVCAAVAEEVRFDTALPSCELIPAGIAFALPPPGPDSAAALVATLGLLRSVALAAGARCNIPGEVEPHPPVASALHGVAAMLNHSSAPSLAVDVQGAGRLSFRALRAVPAGHPLTYNYAAGAADEDEVRRRFAF